MFFICTLVTMLVRSGCHNKIPQTAWVVFVFSQSRGPEVQDRRALGAGSWWGPACWLSSPGVLPASSVCAQGARVLWLVSLPLLIKTPARSDYSGVRVSSFKWLLMCLILSSLFKFPVSEFSHLWKEGLFYLPYTVMMPGLGNHINYVEEYPTK